MPTTLVDEREAEAAYWADARIDAATGELADAADPLRRGELLAALARDYVQQAEVYPVAFGPDPDPDDGGRDQAESLRLTGLLFTVLADVEATVATPGRSRQATTTELEAAAGAVLDRMATTADLTRRTQLLCELEAAVVDVVGPQAAEALWRLPSPGHVGWLTTAANAEWEASLHDSVRRQARLQRRLQAAAAAVMVLVIVAAAVNPLLGVAAAAALASAGAAGWWYLRRRSTR